MGAWHLVQTFSRASECEGFSNRSRFTFAFQNGSFAELASMILRQRATGETSFPSLPRNAKKK
jgi:hypothetical protein